MENELNIPERVSAPDSKKDYADTVLAHALLVSAGARDDLTQAKAVRADAERQREKVESEASKALDEVFEDANAQAQKLMQEAKAAKLQAEAELARARQEVEEATEAKVELEVRCQQMEAETKDTNAQAQKLMEEAAAAKREAEADLARAHQDVEEARLARVESEKRCQQLEAEARERADRVMREVEQQAEELKQRAEEEAHKLLVEAATIHATAQEEMETQRILADAARIQARAIQLQGWANGKSAPQPQRIDHDLSSSHEPTQVKAEEAAPLGDMEPQLLQASTFENGHQESDNG